MPRFFRLVTTNPPRRHDFASYRARRGDPRPGLPEHLVQFWDGVSVHDSVESSKRQARDTPHLGPFIAELVIPDDVGSIVRWKRTGSRNRGHYTLWGDPDVLLGFVVRVVPVEGDDDDDV